MPLRESTSSQRTSFRRLIDEVGAELEAAGDEAAEVQPAPADPRPPHQPNRKLQPDEIGELIQAYRDGATVYELAAQFGLHRQTVSAHLRREGVAMRSRVRMTPRLLERATALYEAGWSTVQIGRELGLGTSTVGKALKRAAVRMRPPVADRWGIAGP